MIAQFCTFYGAEIKKCSLCCSGVAVSLGPVSLSHTLMNFEFQLHSKPSKGAKADVMGAAGDGTTWGRTYSCFSDMPGQSVVHVKRCPAGTGPPRSANASHSLINAGLMSKVIKCLDAEREELIHAVFGGQNLNSSALDH